MKKYISNLCDSNTSISCEKKHQKCEEELKIHKQNIKDVQAAIGYNSVSTYDFPDNRFDTVALLDINKIVEKKKKKFGRRSSSLTMAEIQILIIKESPRL